VNPEVDSPILCVDITPKVNTLCTKNNVLDETLRMRSGDCTQTPRSEKRFACTTYKIQNTVHSVTARYKPGPTQLFVKQVGIPLGYLPERSGPRRLVPGSAESLLSEHGTHTTVKARFWPWLTSKSPHNVSKCSLLAPENHPPFSCYVLLSSLELSNANVYEL